jgi:hypothetical protein
MREIKVAPSTYGFLNGKGGWSVKLAASQDLKRPWNLET